MKFRQIPISPTLTQCRFATIGSRLDYCNSLYYCKSNTNFQRLQRLQNAVARFDKLYDINITQSVSLRRPTKGYMCAAELTKRRRPLLIQSRQITATFVSYLSALANWHTQSLYTTVYRPIACPLLKSSTSDTLSSLHANIATRCLVVFHAHTMWNSFPSFVRTADSFTVHT